MQTNKIYVWMNVGENLQAMLSGLENVNSFCTVKTLLEYINLFLTNHKHTF